MRGVFWFLLYYVVWGVAVMSIPNKGIDGESALRRGWLAVVKEGRFEVESWAA